MLNRKSSNGKNSSKNKEKSLKKEEQQKNKLSPKNIQKLKVNLSSSLKHIQKKKNINIITDKKINHNKKIHFIQGIISKNLQNYNSNNNIKNTMIINNLIDCRPSHFLAIFKDYLIFDYTEEFLRRNYFLYESYDRIPKLFNYYKNYLQFFCKPNFVDTFCNLIIKNSGDSHAEYFYKKFIEKNNKNKNKEALIDEKNRFYEECKNNVNNNDNIEDLVKTIFTKTIKNSIDNIKEDDDNVDDSIKKYESKNRQESTIKCDKNNKISEGNTLLLMLNEMKKKNNKHYQKNLKTMNMKKNILNNKKYSFQIYKAINNKLKNNKIYKRKDYSTNNEKKLLNTYSNMNVKNIDSFRNVIIPEKKKFEPLKLKLKKKQKTILISPKKNYSNLNKNKNYSIMVNTNANTNLYNNRNNNDKYLPSKNISKNKILPLSSLNINILYTKDFSKKELLTSRDNNKTFKSLSRLNMKKNCNNSNNDTVHSRNYKNKNLLKKIKSLDSLEMKEIYSYNKKNNKSYKIKQRNINNKSNHKLFTFNKSINSSINNNNNKTNTNSMKSLIKVNELKNKKLIYQKKKYKIINSP